MIEGMTQNNSAETEKAFLFGLELRPAGTATAEPVWPVEASLRELQRLAHTAGLKVTGMDYQKRPNPHPATYLGSGKLDTVMNSMMGLKTSTLILDDEITPGQLRNIEKILPEDFKVIDRTALILDIFAQHAHTREGQLQVELAQNRYRLPRLTRLWTHLVRQSGARAGGTRGGVGLRGPGETQIESDRRQIRKRIASLTREIEEVRLHRNRYRQKRKKTGLPVVALVGYTNSGKSSLLRCLSRADITVANELFSTLDPTTRRVRLPSGQEALFTDTVGFINKLPHDLVAAFRATLEEIRESDLLLHIVDSIHPRADAQIEVVDRTLAEIGVSGTSAITVWNKTDLSRETTEPSDQRIRISALTGQGVDNLLDKVEDALKEGMVYREMLIPYSDTDMLVTIKKRAIIDEEDHGESGTAVKAWLPPVLAARLKDKYKVGSLEVE